MAMGPPGSELSNCLRESIYIPSSCHWDGLQASGVGVIVGVIVVTGTGVFVGEIVIDGAFLSEIVGV